jgi:hypothetical protein
VNKNLVYAGKSRAPSKPTFFTEVEVIDLTLAILNLLELLHQKEIVHTNLCPTDIFLNQ